METKKKTTDKKKIVDYCFFALMTAAFAALTFVLFYNQATSGVVYHETDFKIDMYHSDMYAYMLEMQGLDSGYSFPYPMFFKLAALFNIFFSPEVSVAAATCLLNTLALIFTKLSFDWILKEEIKKVNEKGKVFLYFAVSLFSASLFFVSMLTPPFYLGTKFRYVGVFSPNPFQNATYMAARPFAVVSYVYFLKLLNEYENDYKGKIKDYIVFCISFLISTMTKPSYTLVLGAAALIVMIVRFAMAKFKTFKQSIFLGLLFLPTIIDLLYQFKGVFVPTEGEAGGIGFGIGKVWLLYTDNIVTSIVFAIMFPLAVLLLNIKRIKSDYKFRFAWIFYLISFCMAFFCLEKGKREVDFNFSWSYMYGIFFVFFESIIVTIEDWTKKKRMPFAIIETLAFLAHLACGIKYFLNIFAGGSYY